MNHFIELGWSEKSGLWITVHSGSRNLGKKICEYWQKVASFKDIPDKKIKYEEIKTQFPKSEWQNQINEYKLKILKIKPSPLDFLEGDNKNGYIEDMKIAQGYAHDNRIIIMAEILRILKEPKIMDQIESVHNYIDTQDGIIRKGAIRSYTGEKMIIPFNMKDGLLICDGKSNPEWNFSAPHGAGRVYSRSKAKETLDMKKFKNDMEGIFSTSVCSGTIDESPDAYKDPKVIEKAINPTANIIDRIIPIHNLKDIESEKSWKDRKRRK